MSLPTGSIAGLVGTKFVPIGIVILLLYGAVDMVKLIDKVEAHETQLIEVKSDQKELLKTITRVDKNVAAIKEHFKVHRDDESE